MNTSRMRVALIITGLAAVTIGATLLWAQGKQGPSTSPGPQPSFGTLGASPPNVVFNTPTTVVFTIQIDTPTLNPTTVDLQHVNEAGELISTVGRMYDNGHHGDSKAGDRIFAMALTLNEPSIGRQYYRVTAAFRGNHNSAQSATVIVDVDPIPLPPDPGEAGKQTLVGIDSDNDSVRDDVQRWIVLNFIESELAINVLRSDARAVQAALAATTTDQRITAAIEEAKAGACFSSARRLSGLDVSVGQVADQMLNTTARRSAYDAYAQKIDVNDLGLEVLLSDLPAVCGLASPQ
jgi:hypothetical protein